jgi:urease accessory protein
LQRRIEADCAGDATLVIAEITVFGRPASGETVREASLADRWRIRRNGVLIYADETRLGPADFARSGEPGLLGGAASVASAVIVAPDIEERLDRARDLLTLKAEADCRIGVSTWNGMMVLRGRARDPRHLKEAMAAFWRGMALFDVPRVWM